MRWDQESIDWAKAHRFKRSRAGRCLHWVSVGRCGVAFCNIEYRSHWMDHVTCWIEEDGIRLLLSQPYHVGMEGMADIQRYCREFGLEAYIDGRGFYGHGTVAIWIRQLAQVKMKQLKRERELEARSPQGAVARRG